MATLSWADIVEMTTAAAKQELLDQLQAVGFSATSWQPFSIPITTIEAVAAVRSKLSRVAVYLREAFLSETAVGEALTQLSKSHYDNNRFGSTVTRRVITLTCSATAGPYVINRGALVVSDDGNHTFRNADPDLAEVYPATLNSGGTLTRTFDAEMPGKAANVANGSVTRLVTTLAGVTIQSDTLVVPGKDQETDQTLQARNSSKWALLSQFELTDDAVEQIALTAGVGLITTVAVNSTNPRGPGTFDVYLAGDAAPSGGTEIGYVQAVLDKLVMGPAGTAKALAAYDAPLSVAGTVYYDASFTGDIQAAVEAALVEYLKTVPLGGWDFSPGPSHVVTLNDLEAVIRDAQVNGQAVRKTVSLSSPIGDFAVVPWGKVWLSLPTGLVFVPISTT